MSPWPSVKAKKVLAGLQAIGWRVKRQTGSHKTLQRAGYPDFVFAFHDGEEIARECYPVLQRIPDFNPPISELRAKSANTAIHLIRHRSISLPLGARWVHSLRPGDGAALDAQITTINPLALLD